MGKLHTKIIRQKRKNKKRAVIEKKLRTRDLQKSNKTESASLFRERAGVRLLETNEESIPNCPHGPCLLFADKNNKWFGCAVYRSEDLCNYKIILGDDDSFNHIDAKPLKFEYGDGILSKINLKSKQKLLDVYWCSTCSSYVTIPHKDPVDGPFKLDEISMRPSQLLSASKTNKGMAQYWFSPNVLSILNNVLADFDSVLCIGCPSVFEEQWKKKSSFLLDFDHRFSNFYSKDDFAHYNLMNNHFYQKNGKTQLKSFTKKAKSLCIVVDPPFGVILSALEKSLDKLKQSLLSASPSSRVSSIIFLPIFIGKHLNGMSIVDYKVTYSNHATFKCAKKTIVRIFTDINPMFFKLPSNEGYRFCEECQLYASKNHCDQCGRCPIDVFGTSKHCDRVIQNDEKTNYSSAG